MTAHPRKTFADPGVGDIHAEPGSREWAIAVRLQLESKANSMGTGVNDVAMRLERLFTTGAWSHLFKEDGSTFASIEEYIAYAKPYGMGVPVGVMVRYLNMVREGRAVCAHLTKVAPADGVPCVLPASERESVTVHPAADLLPMLLPDALNALAEDIRVNGQREPIVLWDGQLLDGRNRLAACDLAGVTPVFTALASCPDPVAYVLSANLYRRHLDESERALVGARAMPLLSEKARERQVALAGTRHGDLSADLRGGQTGKASEQAARMVNVSPRTVEAAAKVLRHGAPELVAAVERREVKVSAAAQIAALPLDEQVAAVKDGKVKEKARAARSAKPVQPTIDDEGKSFQSGQLSERAAEEPGRVDGPVVDAGGASGEPPASDGRSMSKRQRARRLFRSIYHDGEALPPREALQGACWLLTIAAASKAQEGVEAAAMQEARSRILRGEPATVEAPVVDAATVAEVEALRAELAASRAEVETLRAAALDADAIRAEVAAIRAEVAANREASEAALREQHAPYRSWLEDLFKQPIPGTEPNLDKLVKLLAMSASPNENEARTAAMMVCKIIRDHRIRLVTRDGKQTALSDEEKSILESQNDFLEKMRREREESFARMERELEKVLNLVQERNRQIDEENRRAAEEQSRKARRRR